jgi:hypothetical protein
MKTNGLKVLEGFAATREETGKSYALGWLTVSTQGHVKIPRKQLSRRVIPTTLQCRGNETFKCRSFQCNLSSPKQVRHELKIYASVKLLNGSNSPP